MAILFLVCAGYLLSDWFSGFYDWAMNVRARDAKHKREHWNEYNWNYPDEFPVTVHTSKEDTRNLTWDQRAFEDELIRQTTEQALRDITPFEQGGDNIDYGLNPSFEPPDPPQNFGGMF